MLRLPAREGEYCTERIDSRDTAQECVAVEAHRKCSLDTRYTIRELRDLRTCIGSL